MKTTLFHQHGGPEVLDPTSSEQAKVHIWELKLL
jgi:hypothetical protein